MLPSRRDLLSGTCAGQGIEGVGHDRHRHQAQQAHRKLQPLRGAPRLAASQRLRGSTTPLASMGACWRTAPPFAGQPSWSAQEQSMRSARACPFAAAGSGLKAACADGPAAASATADPSAPTSRVPSATRSAEGSGSNLAAASGPDAASATVLPAALTSSTPGASTSAWKHHSSACRQRALCASQ